MPTTLNLAKLSDDYKKYGPEYIRYKSLLLDETYLCEVDKSRVVILTVEGVDDIAIGYQLDTQGNVIDRFTLPTFLKIESAKNMIDCDIQK